MTEKLKRPGFWIVLILATVLGLVVLDRLERLETLQNRPAQAPSPLAVRAVPAAKGTISKWVCGEGTAEAVRKRHLLFQTSGKVTFITRDMDKAPLQEGSRVKGPERAGAKGHCLARLDSRELEEELRLIRTRQAEAEQDLEMARAVLAQAEQKLALAKNKYQRSKKLYERKARPLSVLEEDETSWQHALADTKGARARVKASQAGVKGLEARHAQALINLENAALYAPFDGVIARLNISEGDYFAPAMVDHSSGAGLQDTAPITIIDPGLIEVTLNLPLFDGMAVAPGQKTFIQWGSMDWHRQEDGRGPAADADANSEHFLKAWVHSVSPVLSLSGRTVRIKVRARQDQPVLPHGLFVTCWIEVEQKSDALLIPTAGLLFRDGMPYVYVEKQGLARQRPIRIGLADRDRVEVLEGVAPGEKVITDGRYRLFPDRPVKIVERGEDNQHEA